VQHVPADVTIAEPYLTRETVNLRRRRELDFLPFALMFHAMDKKLKGEFEDARRGLTPDFIRLMEDASGRGAMSRILEVNP
jgi:hypothetical protein